MTKSSSTSNIVLFLIKFTTLIIASNTVSRFDFIDLYSQMIFRKQMHANLSAVWKLLAQYVCLFNHFLTSP